MTPNHANETFSQADLPALRKTMRERRKSLPTAIQQAHAKQAAIFFAAEFSKALSNRPLKIAIYSAVAGELDPAPLQHSIDSEGCEFYLPIIDKKQLRYLLKFKNNLEAGIQYYNELFLANKRL